MLAVCGPNLTNHKMTKVKYFKMGLKEMYVPIFLIPFGFVNSPPFDLKSALYAKQSLLLGNRLNVNSSKGCKHTSRYFRFIKSTSKPFDEKLISKKTTWILFNHI